MMKIIIFSVAVGFGLAAIGIKILAVMTQSRMWARYAWAFVLAAWLLIGLGWAARADVALMLNPQEQQKLLQFVARGLADHPEDAQIGVYLLNKINTAPAVTDRKEAPAEPPKTEEPNQ